MKMETKKISKYEWKIEKEGGMKVPVTIYASEKLLQAMKQDITLDQIKNVSMLKGIVKHAICLPDAHQGYGFPIGGVAAFNLEEGIVSPGGVGYDINCGVRLLASDLRKSDIEEKKKEIINQLFRDVPSGVGRGGAIKITKEDIKDILEKGSGWAVKKGYGLKEDLERTEDEGCIKGAKAKDVSERAIKRGLPQLGSLGAGNHFLEVQEVDEIFDKKTAEKFGIKEKGQITVMIHCGSRGLGHQVASDYIKLMEDKYGWKDLPDRELINAPIKSELGQRYLSAMAAAANFGFCNRQMIMQWTRDSFNKIFGKVKLDLIYDVAHNVAKIEEHFVYGKKIKLCVHRKGATRAFKDQPVIIPGSMGTASYLLVGTEKAEQVSFGSTAHGAGRSCSRAAASRNLSGEKIRDELASKGIEVKAGSWKGLVQEAPQAYKDIDEVVKVSHEVGIGKLVARLKPLAVMKG
ncbi:MAG: RtcB family protein [archaeon]